MLGAYNIKSITFLSPVSDETGRWNRLANHDWDPSKPTAAVSRNKLPLISLSYCLEVDFLKELNIIV